MDDISDEALKAAYLALADDALQPIDRLASAAILILRPLLGAEIKRREDNAR